MAGDRPRTVYPKYKHKSEGKEEIVDSLQQISDELRNTVEQFDNLGTNVSDKEQPRAGHIAMTSIWVRIYPETGY